MGRPGAIIRECLCVRLTGQVKESGCVCRGTGQLDLNAQVRRVPTEGEDYDILFENDPKLDFTGLTMVHLGTEIPLDLDSFKDEVEFMGDFFALLNDLEANPHYEVNWNPGDVKYVKGQDFPETMPIYCMNVVWAWLFGVCPCCEKPLMTLEGAGTGTCSFRSGDECLGYWESMGYEWDFDAEDWRLKSDGGYEEEVNGISPTHDGAHEDCEFCDVVNAPDFYNDSLVEDLTMKM